MLYAAWLVSLVAFASALFLLVRLVRTLTAKEDVAYQTAWFLAAYPFAVYFSAPYSEGLFLLGMCGLFLAVVERRWARGVAWGLLTGLTRPNGWLLAIPLALMVRRDGIRGGAMALIKRAVVVTSPLVGTLAYTCYLYLRFGDGFAWIRGPAAWGREYRPLHLFALDRLAFMHTHGLSGYLTAMPFDALNTFAALLALAVALPVARRFGAEYGALIAVLVLPPLLVGGSMSIGRMTSVLFPLFIWLAEVVPVRHRPVMLSAGASLQGLCAALFFTWRPLF